MTSRQSAPLKASSALLIGILLSLSIGTANASLIGDTVKLEDPIGWFVNGRPGVRFAEVGPDIEFQWDSGLFMDISGDSIRIGSNGPNGFLVLDPDIVSLFLFELSDLDWLPSPGSITGISVEPNPELGLYGGADIDFSFTSNSVRWDLHGWIFGPLQQELPHWWITINLETSHDDAPVPVPATIALFGLGLAGIGWSRRKRI